MATKEVHDIQTETLGEHAPFYATVKTVWYSLKVVIFTPPLRLVLDVTKHWTPRKLLNKFTN